MRMSAYTWMGVGNKPPKQITVVLSTGVEELYLAPIFLYFSLVQPIAGGYERAVGGIHLLPVQGDCAEGLSVCFGRHLYIGILTSGPWVTSSHRFLSFSELLL